MKHIKKLTTLALLGIVSVRALALRTDQASALELRDHKPVHQQYVQLEEPESESEENEHVYLQQEAQHQIGKWTEMDSAIRDAENEIILGGNALEEKRQKGELTTLSGFNDQYDSQVTKYRQPGDPAMDDDFLRKVFHRHYTLDHGDGPDSQSKKGDRILTRDNAWLASKEVVQKWDHVGPAEAEDYLNKNFERVWQRYDLNNEGKIKVYEAFNFEKSLLGSFSITYSEE